MRVEILIVIDRAEKVAELAEFVPFRLAPERALGDHRIQDVDLAGRDEMVPLARAKAGL